MSIQKKTKVMVAAIAIWAIAIPVVLAYNTHSYTPCWSPASKAFWLPCEGVQYVGKNSGWMWWKYHDNSVYSFWTDDQAYEFEWSCNDVTFPNTRSVTVGVTNFFDPVPDHAEWWDPGGQEYGIAEHDPNSWVKNTQYHASFTTNMDLPSGYKSELRVEYGEWGWYPWPLWQLS